MLIERRVARVSLSRIFACSLFMRGSQSHKGGTRSIVLILEAVQLKSCYLLDLT